MLSSKEAMYTCKKSRFIKEKEKGMNWLGKAFSIWHHRCILQILELNKYEQNNKQFFISRR